jgi:hypothetical protein
MFYFIYDGTEAYLTHKVKEVEKKQELKEVGSVNCKEGIVKLMYNKPFMKNVNKKLNGNGNGNEAIFPVLKSNLQKQVRRGYKEAVSTAEAMMEMNEFELLRRLSIIAAEDVILCSEISNIVWLMTAVSKGFILNANMKKFVLNTVYNLTMYPTCRRLQILKNKEYNGLKEELTLNDILTSSFEKKELLAGIFFRYYFGGLSGDLPMLSRLCDDYLVSSLEGKQGKQELISINQKDLFVSLEILENPNSQLSICDAAIDFHVYPKLLELIKEDTGYSSELIKRCIWECSSRLNFRYKEETELLEMWKKIENSFLYHSKTYLAKLLHI